MTAAIDESEIHAVQKSKLSRHIAGVVTAVSRLKAETGGELQATVLPIVMDHINSLWAAKHAGEHESSSTLNRVASVLLPIVSQLATLQPAAARPAPTAACSTSSTSSASNTASAAAGQTTFPRCGEAPTNSLFADSALAADRVGRGEEAPSEQRLHGDALALSQAKVTELA